MLITGENDGANNNNSDNINHIHIYWGRQELQ